MKQIQIDLNPGAFSADGGKDETMSAKFPPHGDFGHFFGVVGSDSRFHWDAWGAGPFLIDVAGKTYSFEDSAQFGPALLKANGELRSNPSPGEGSPFWRAHWLWRRQGRKVDGKQCIWREPAPSRYAKRRGRLVLIEEGEQDGMCLLDGRRLHIGTDP